MVVFIYISWWFTCKNGFTGGPRQPLHHLCWLSAPSVCAAFCVSWKIRKIFFHASLHVSLLLHHSYLPKLCQLNCCAFSWISKYIWANPPKAFCLSFHEMTPSPILTLFFKQINHCFACSHTNPWFQDLANKMKSGPYRSVTVLIFNGNGFYVWPYIPKKIIIHVGTWKSFMLGAQNYPSY